MSKTAKILVVEDDDTLREALCDTIEYGGYESVAASNGLEALQCLQSTTFDLIISDVQMDKMDGLKRRSGKITKVGDIEKQRGEFRGVTR